MHFALALAIAVSFWHARGVEVPCAPVAVSGADARLPYDALAPAGKKWRVPMAAWGCEILISRETGFLRVDAAADYCLDVVHEVGHIAGLGHTPTGVMALAPTANDIPWDCSYWRRAAKRLHVPLSAWTRRHPYATDT
jgi:hypothetical protein